jgi:hypothetical protein
MEDEKPSEIRRRKKAKALETMVATGRKTQYGHSAPTMDIQAVYAGVTVGWLAQAFNIDPITVKKRLADCPALERRKAGYIYELRIAARYLVKPVFDVEAYMKTMKIEELPTRLQETYWSAKVKRQNWEKEAGDLWSSEDVLDVMGSTFQTMKFTMQLWADNLDRMTGLSLEQRELLVKSVDTLQDEMYASLEEKAREKNTLSELEKYLTGEREEKAKQEDDDFDDVL